MFEFNNEIDSCRKLCPHCRGGRLKSWKELTSDEKFVAERQPTSATVSPADRRLHLFCTRCQFETMPAEERV